MEANVEPGKKRRIMHVVKNHIGGWNVWDKQKEILLGYAPTKAKAEQIAKQIAEQIPLCRVKVYKVDGSIEKDYTYISYYM
jgi:hypothetical protein